MAARGNLSPEQRALRSRIAAHSKWAGEADPSAATAPARRAFLDRFEREADPDGTLDSAERVRRAEHLRRAHFARLAFASAKARARRAGKPAPDDRPTV